MTQSLGSSTPSPASTFPSPEVAEFADAGGCGFDLDAGLAGRRSRLHGPAILEKGAAIIVPQDNVDTQLQQQPQQSKHQEVLMLSRMAQLPLQLMDKWNYDQKMVWMKCMLTRHLPQPEPQKLEQRLQDLQRVEQLIGSQPQAPLNAYIDMFAMYFDVDVVQKLHRELIDWRQVCDTIAFPVSYHNSLSAPLEKIVGDHLWEHILRLLMNRDATVEWLNIHEGLFKFVDSSGAARSWGMTKGNQNMSYEKMSRSIRQYYTELKNGIIQKAVEFPKLHYRFNMRHPEVVNFLRKNFLATCQSDEFLGSVVNSC